MFELNKIYNENCLTFMKQAQIRILDYLNNMLCECEKPANFTIFVTKLKAELTNNELTV